MHDQSNDLATFLKSRIDRLRAEQHWVRLGAAYSLAAIGRQALPALPALMEALKDNCEDVREFAAYALGEIGPEASSAVPALFTALQDDNNELRCRAALALGKLGAASDAILALQRVTSDPNDDVRKTAILTVRKTLATSKRESA